MGYRRYLALTVSLLFVGYCGHLQRAESQQATPVYVADPAPTLGTACGYYKRVLVSTANPAKLYCCAGGLLNPKWTDCSYGFTMPDIGFPVPQHPLCQEWEKLTNDDAGYRCTPIDMTVVRAINDAGYVWDDLRVPLASLSKPGVTAPDWVLLMNNAGTGGTTTGVYTWSFRATQEDDLMFQAQMPHGWAPGTEVEAHIHWTMLTTTAGANDAGSVGAYWNLECAIGAIGGQFNVTDTTLSRAHTGTTATLNVGVHKFEVGQNIAVSGVTETGCAANAYNGTFRIISVGTSTISYTTITSCEQTLTADLGGAVEGYTITRLAPGIVVADSKWKHLMTDFGSYRMANCTTVSCIWSCRVSRPTSTIDIQESIPALEVDFHYMLGAIGSRQETAY